MKTLKILVILCFISGFGLECTKAQVPSKNSFQTTDKITSLSIGNLSRSYSWLTTSPLTFPGCLVPVWTDITKKPGFIFHATSGNYFDLTTSPTLLNDKSTTMSWKLTTMGGYNVTGTFNSKWEKLTGKPLIDTTSLYCYPLKRTNEPTLSDNQVYRFAGNLFHMVMRYKYPGAYVPVEYPQVPYSQK